MNNINLDYSKIREHEGSKQTSFEELVCQIAHLSPPNDADDCVRKDGKGGDAGVECFWKLKDGSEHGWQAKYFLNQLTSNQWKQVSDSVKTALEKHPKLTKYYICMPCDRTDSRKKVKGKETKSSLDKWEGYIKKWKKLAKSKGMTVEFHYWGKHELNLKLSSEGLSGRALFWFNEPLINFEKLRSIAKSSKQSLGERYTEEAHQDLPIAKSLMGVGLDPEWYKELKECNEKLLKLKSKFNQEFVGCQSLSDINKTIQKTSVLIDSIQKDFFQSVEKNNFLEIKNENLNKIKNLEDLFEKINEYIWKKRDENQKEQSEENNIKSLSRNIIECKGIIEEILNFFQGEKVKGAINKAILIQGKAGIGKSHLLCDFSLKRLDSSLPTLFILGQHYTTGNIFDFLIERLDLKQFSKQQVLQALNAFGKTHQSRFLIVIDAINEGPKRSNWYDNIEDFLSELSKFKNIGIILSCRDTYIDYTIPKNESRLVHIKHSGFKGFEHRAATLYCNYYDISRPTVPILSPEFSNPLFVKICCKALKESGETSFPKGLMGITALFEFYLESVTQVINRKKEYRQGENIVDKTIKSFVSKLFPNNLYGLSIEETRVIINECDSKPHFGEPLTDLLIKEGVVSLDLIPIPDFSEKTRGTEVVRFTYERFSDYFIALNLMEQSVKNPINEKSKIINIRKCIKYNKIYEPKFMGIAEALGIIIPEKYELEFIDFVPKSSDYYEYFFRQSFLKTLSLRSPHSFSKRTLELFNKIQPSSFYDERVDILLSLSMGIGHPWNADFLDGTLREKSLPERDLIWSIPISLSDGEEDEDINQPESILRTIINWSIDTSLDNAENEQLRLIAIVLLWVTTCTNRTIRDQATKALARIFSYIPQDIPVFIEKYNDINDPYLVERLYAAIYGAILLQKDDQIIKKIANTVYNIVFKYKKPYPHILLRDYAQGILEYAHYKNLFDKNIVLENFKPPYKSDWPIENPTIEEIEALTGDGSFIKSSVINGDFGIYTMSCVHYWSPTILAKTAPETRNELKKKFKEKCLQGDEVKDEEEHCRWLSGLKDNCPPAFSRKWAQRWVCKRAYELGWSKELFENFDKHNCQYIDRSRPKIERIGKKYQWIAFHELLGRMSDNLCWIDNIFGDLKFLGPWQVHQRDIDPTFFWKKKERKSEYFKSNNWKHTPWLQREPIFHFTQGNLDVQKKWLWNQKLNIPIPQLIKTQFKNDKNWLVLDGDTSWDKSISSNNNLEPLEPSVWVRINSIVIKREDLGLLKSNIVNKEELQSPSLVEYPNERLGFFREFPWRFYQDVEEWIKFNPNGRSGINVDYLNPAMKYTWEPGDQDCTTDNPYIEIHTPSKTLIKDLGLFLCDEDKATWKNSNDEVVFIDPSITTGGQSHALIREDLLQQWLEQNKLMLIWLIGGEKRLFKNRTSFFDHQSYGILSYSAFLYYNKGANIDCKIWFKKEPHNFT